MEMKRKDLEHIALLARLDLSPEELDAMKIHMDRMLQYVEKLNELDTAEVPPAPSVLDLSNVYRDDTPASSLSPEDALQNAPEKEEGGFRVPQVLE
jgi:aspartyl-tRNA(Asn)/glutamyl-tRNA(Gln) amidotransferase subunit C